MADKFPCVACRKEVTKTKNDRYRSHSDGDGEPCEMSSVQIPEHVLAQPTGRDDAPDVPREGIDFATCPQCERKVKLTRLGYFEPHDQTLRGGDRCETSGVRAKHARKTETVPLPGDDPLPPSAAVPEERDSARPGVLVAAEARKPLELTAGPSSLEPTTMSEGSSSPEESSPGTSSDASEEEPAAAGPFQLAPNIDDRILQPFSHIFQPFPVPPKVKLADSMSDRGKMLAARLRELFYAYTNRDSSDNRSAQIKIGPSEAGSPCDRQIAMKLLGVKPTNPQEGWAPFVGTAVHAELARMFEWANGGGNGSGRFVTEMPVTFGNPFVPRGTLDLLDRVLYMVDDHKLMGRWSLDNLIQKGPSETYRVQIQIYGLGAVLAGEKVREVAIIGWPRQESSLDKLYVHVEPFDRKIAEAALDRVARIAAEVKAREGIQGGPMKAAQEFSPGDDCKWCPFHLKGDKGFTRGCPGK